VFYHKIRQLKEVAMPRSKEKIPIFDIHTASFLELKHISPELTLEGTRVVFEFNSSEEVYKLLKEYQSNPSVPLLDYVSVLRRLRSKMLSMRDMK
jgi:hypothetical protein